MDEPGERKAPVVGFVGPCCAGKTTIVKALCARGYNARVIAQEHSFAPRMWEIITHPDFLVFLDVSVPVAQQRRWMRWTPADMGEQRRRLSHAREHCDFYLDTDGLTVAEVVERLVKAIAEFNVTGGPVGQE
jgi:deoxyadenosine/deoxycytidine kinase